ncbi:MAG: RluA family pseudouridine synthase [Deltaproteobacteria bacterium]|nr:RluA family pseudouridine synthase [Deltaproteobacteria bacterium]
MNTPKKLDHAFTSKYWSWTYLDAAELPTSLCEALAQKLPHLSAASWPERFRLGGVYINGLPVGSDTALPLPCKIEYYEPKFEIDEAASFFPCFSDQNILYRDDDMMVVFKPAGISCMPARDQNVFHLKAQIEEYLGRVIHMPSRIDMSAQGLVVVSTSTRMHKHLQHAFQFRRIEKRYLVGSTRRPNWDEFSLDAPIGRDPEHPVLRKVDGTRALPSLTHFRVLESHADGRTLLEAKPHTGRTHQIRVHIAHLGYPIRGDKFYGGDDAPMLQLLSYSFSLPHPFTRTQLSVTVPPRLLPEWAKNFNWTKAA